MCTAITYKTNDFYFGRTLDYEFSYGDEVTITPRNYPFKFRHSEIIKNHYAIIGMAHIAEGYPLYYDAVNEKGLGIAGLNFVGNAEYSSLSNNKKNVAQFEFIPMILSQCSNIFEVKKMLSEINITNTEFSKDYPCAKLHWIIADFNQSITVEAMKKGLYIYDNPVGVLTNNPPFNIQLFLLNNYMSVSPKPPNNSFSKKINLTQYSRGMGTLGLPGDLSSMSRFVKATFTKLNSVSKSGEKESISQFFHILGSVEQQRGCCEVGNGNFEISIYTSCCNATKGIYYYKTYENSQITAVDMNKENIESKNLISYPIIQKQQIYFQN